MPRSKRPLGASGGEAATDETKHTMKIEIEILKAAERHLIKNYSQSIEDVIVCEFSSEDSTPTLHLYFWRGADVASVEGTFNHLVLACEGDSHTGPVRCYQARAVPTPDGVGFVERIENGGFFKVRFPDGDEGSYAQEECQ